MGNWDKNIVGSSKKEKIYVYQRVNKKENFKNMDIDSMEESDNEYIPSSDEEDIYVASIRSNAKNETKYFNLV